jgi:hypothetical protein
MEKVLLLSREDGSRRRSGGPLVRVGGGGGGGGGVWFWGNRKFGFGFCQVANRVTRPFRLFRQKINAKLFRQ